MEAQRKSCIDSSKVDPQRIIDIRSGIFDDSSDNLKEYAGCICKKLNFFFDSGDVNRDAIKKILSGTEEERENLVKKCVTKKNSLQQTCYDFYKCFVLSNPALVPGTF